MFSFMAVAGDIPCACAEILSVAKELTKDNVKDLEFLLSLMHPPWTLSDDADNHVVLEKMKQRGIWVFDINAKRCDLLLLADYMHYIDRRDLGQRLRTLGKVSEDEIFIFHQKLLLGKLGLG